MTVRHTVMSLILLASPLAAQRMQRDSLLDRLAGNWVLRGTIAGQQVVHDVSARWVLDNDDATGRRPFARVTLSRK